MNLMNLFLSVGVIGGADGPTAVFTTGLPLPALTVSIFAVAFVVYVYAAKAIAEKKAPVAEAAVQAPAAPAVTPAVYTGPILTGVEEKEAAVIMAIVSDKTGIPLEKLKFESIKLLEDK
ncbi:MAG: hypothetical protein IJB74_07820 [Clostridia bacterium]|nr:hypothetical protein [Clostridia bacterium]